MMHCSLKLLGHNRLGCVIPRGCSMGPACPEHSLQGKHARGLYADIARVFMDLRERTLQALQAESGQSPFSHCFQFNCPNLIPFPKLVQLWGWELCLSCLEVPVILQPGLCQPWRRLYTSWQFWQAWGMWSCHFCIYFFFIIPSSLTRDSSLNHVGCVNQAVPALVPHLPSCCIFQALFL